MALVRELFGLESEEVREAPATEALGPGEPDQLAEVHELHRR
jgi:hypothetical protein